MTLLGLFFSGSEGIKKMKNLNTYSVYSGASTCTGPHWLVILEAANSDLSSHIKITGTVCDVLEVLLANQQRK